MNQLSLKLHPGDDVKYHVTGSQSQLLGRVTHVGASSFYIKRFIFSSAYTEDVEGGDGDDEEDDDDHSTDSTVLPRMGLQEVILTNETDELPPANVDGIIFVLSIKCLISDPISFAGMDDVFFLKFAISHENHKIRIEDWNSFRSYSYSCQIFEGLQAVRSVMSKALNRTSMVQVEKSSGKINFFSSDSFSYIAHSLEGVGSTRSRIANNTLKRIYNDRSKKKVRIQTNITEIFIDTPDGIDCLAHLFGVLATKGSRSKHPKLGEPLRPILYGTTLNNLSSIKFSYCRELKCLSVYMRYNSMVVSRH